MEWVYSKNWEGTYSFSSGTSYTEIIGNIDEETDVTIESEGVILKKF